MKKRTLACDVGTYGLRGCTTTDTPVAVKLRPASSGRCAVALAGRLSPVTCEKLTPALSKVVPSVSTRVSPPPPAGRSHASRKKRCSGSKASKRAHRWSCSSRRYLITSASSAWPMLSVMVLYLCANDGAGDGIGDTAWLSGMRQPAPQNHVDMLPQSLAQLPGMACRRLGADIGTGRYQRAAEGAAQCHGNRVRTDPQRDACVGAGQPCGRVVRWWQQPCMRPGPGGAGALPGCARIGNERQQRLGPCRHQNQALVDGSFLGRQQALDRVRVERITGQAPDAF